MKKNLFITALLFSGVVAFSQTTRMSLFEEFTGETCGPCASTNPGLNTTLAANPTKVIAIKWQVPIPTAPSNTWSLYQTNSGEANARLTYYAVNSAPQGRMDGQHLTAFGASTDHAANVNNALISTAQSYTSPFSISMTRAWNSGCSAVDLTVTIQASANYTSSGALNFRTAMVERLVQFSVQPGTNGEKDFYDPVIRTFVTSIPTAWVSGQTHTFTLSCTIPTYTRDKNQVALVGFIQNEGNKYVLQAQRADMVNLPSNDAITTLDAKVNVACSSTIAPVISLKNSGPNTISAFTVVPYTDGVAGTPTQWAGNLSTGTSTTMILNAIATSTTTGSHSFSFAVITPNNYVLTNISNSVKYMVASNYQTMPIAQTFNTSLFPPSNWVPVNPNSGPSWSWANFSGSYGDPNEFGCVKFDFYNNTVIGDVDELYLPPIDLSGTATPTLTFDLAKAPRAGENDELDILVSKDCGATWMNVYSKAGPTLSTATAVATAYQGTAPADWITETVVLNGFASPNVLVKFAATNNNGNNMFIDNINLSQPSTLGLSKINRDGANVTLFPNPATNETTLKIKSDNPENPNIKIINAIGQVVYSKQLTTYPGTTNFNIDTKEFSTGVYFVIIEAGKNSTSKKLIISK